MSEILEIHIAPNGSSPMHTVGAADLEAGKGVVGDRYYNERGTFSEKLAGLPDKELTLIESEEVDSFNEEYKLSFSYGDFRRNIVTKGVRLNQLVGKEFTLGSVRLKGIRLCEPCAHLATILTSEIMPALVHKSGLRAQIVVGGNVCTGDPASIHFGVE